MIESVALQKYSLFGGLLMEQINTIIPLMTRESYEPGADIITEGAPNDKIRFILEGRVAVVKKGIILSEFGEGDAFGEMEVLDVMPSIATIKTLTHTKVMSISNRCLREIYKTDIKSFSLIIMNLARDLSRRLRRMDERVADIKGQP
ncbi:MAG: cyclic nucleotide-binding domain-containing protein [Treponema sp.]|nr:cyclic nucleotide-binding domain-containing protein [Treponema sp.]